MGGGGGVVIRLFWMAGEGNKNHLELLRFLGDA